MNRRALLLLCVVSTFGCKGVIDGNSDVGHRTVVTWDTNGKPKVTMTPIEAPAPGVATSALEHDPACSHLVLFDQPLARSQDPSTNVLCLQNPPITSQASLSDFPRGPSSTWTKAVRSYRSNGTPGALIDNNDDAALGVPCPEVFASSAQDAGYYGRLANEVELFGPTGGVCVPGQQSHCDANGGVEICDVNNQWRTVTTCPGRPCVDGYCSGNGISIYGLGNGGLIVSNPPGIQCHGDAFGNLSGTCSASFPQDTQVTLTATPNSDTYLVQWNGRGCKGSNPTCTVRASGEIPLNVEFDYTP
jgi:hypothetical protein